MTKSEFQELIGEIDLKEFAEDFNKIHTHHVERILYYELEYKECVLLIYFTVYGRNTQSGFKLAELYVTHANLWQGEENEIELSIPKVTMLQKQMSNRFKELF